MVTIADVARAAGVSRATVSYVLTGKRTISEAVTARVRAVISELGYTPNAGARALATSQTRVIALMARFLSDEFAPAMLEYIRAVSDGARSLGYDTLLISDEDGVDALRRVASSRMVDGIVLLNIGEFDDRLPVLSLVDQPSVMIGLPGDPTGLNVFDLDFYATGRAMVEHLHANGHREMILISQPREVVERGGAYVLRLADGAATLAAELGVALHHYHAPVSSPEVGVQVHGILDRHPHATAVLLNNEAVAAALPIILRDRDLRVPEDISVIGRYSDNFARAFSLPFTAFDSGAEELGRRAVSHLVARIDGSAVDGELDLLPPVLHDRGSVAGPPTGTR